MTDCKMWFGTQDFMTWIPTPLSGADVSPAAWGSSGVLIDGSGYAMTSFNSHKTYDYSWPQSSTRRDAQLMKSFFEGSFGRGKIFFVEPTIYDTNVLSARWADPSVTCDYEGPSLVPGVNPRRVARTGTAGLRLPTSAAQYSFGSYSQTRRESAGIFVPIPEGHSLYVHYFGEISASPGDNAPQVWVGYVSLGGTVLSPVALTPLTPSAKRTNGAGAVRVTVPRGFIGAQIWIGASTTGESVTGTLTINAIQANIIEDSQISAWAPLEYPGWIGGQGHSGVRFESPPTYTNENGVDGGQIGYGASFIESVV